MIWVKNYSCHNIFNNFYLLLIFKNLFSSMRTCMNVKTLKVLIFYTFSVLTFIQVCIDDNKLLKIKRM